MLKLNIGCGSNKLKDYINIDTEASCEPDLVHNLLEKSLPYDNSSVDEIVFFHCIEHIRKCYHQVILTEFFRVLKLSGRLYISYPNFWECAQRWKRNEGGERTFWEATLYGRQLYESDYHVCAMDPDQLAELLNRCGFNRIISTPELAESYNTITFCMKSEHPMQHYEDVISNDIKHMEIEAK